MILNKKTINLSSSKIEFDFLQPLSYNFRVAEHVDDAGKIVRVGLQVQVWEHNEFGSGNIVKDWADVKRVTVDKKGLVVSK